jgi:triosephosphate isomerase|tara:strand:- start:3616 stop:4296 length:681 start_codon:yes stop_codon:yes gene_type:complete
LILKEPTIFINFKTYPQATAQNALKLAKIIDDVSKESGITIFLSPQFMDISPIISEYDIPIFVQHIDYVKPGKNTGHVTPESVKQAGCVGALINHSEKPLSDNEITTTIERCKETELISCICASNAEETRTIAAKHPDMMIVEIPELIGTGKAISTIRPEVISDAIKVIRDIDEGIFIISGSGISTKEDVTKAIELGMQGVGASRAFVTSEDPKQVLTEMSKALLK